ncbi:MULTISPECIES: VTT domain-containing protein [Arthrobacter]|uniref:VTT domain-containing protein n=2 Tax=Arthrobacter TaxID=1663 RepID=A0ABU9KGX7_9MICC|nr:VTT domain-containing protein [Arthrobacter sp. YJM1]MDP5226130.1 VTT domain-containing protein [Arthrobacter sp. YJM1]
MDFLLNLPFHVAFPALFVIVMCRANATYWLGRGAVNGLEKTRLAARLTGAKAGTAQRWIAKWGPGAVVVSFLTIGVQTAVNFSAGAGRMPLKRYLPAVTLGSLIWAFLYATAILALIDAWLGLVTGSPWAWVAVLLLALAVVALVLVRRRRRSGSAAVSPVDADVSP